MRKSLANTKNKIEEGGESVRGEDEEEKTSNNSDMASIVTVRKTFTFLLSQRGVLIFKEVSNEHAQKGFENERLLRGFEIRMSSMTFN